MYLLYVRPYAAVPLQHRSIFTHGHFSAAPLPKQSNLLRIMYSPIDGEKLGKAPIPGKMAGVDLPTTCTYTLLVKRRPANTCSEPAPYGHLPPGQELVRPMVGGLGVMAVTAFTFCAIRAGLGLKLVRLLYILGRNRCSMQDSNQQQSQAPPPCPSFSKYSCNMLEYSHLHLHFHLI